MVRVVPVGRSRIAEPLGAPINLPPLPPTTANGLVLTASTGADVGAGEGVGEGLGVGVGDGLGDGVAVGVGGSTVGVGVGGTAVAVAVGALVDVAGAAFTAVDAGVALGVLVVDGVGGASAIMGKSSMPKITNCSVRIQPVVPLSVRTTTHLLSPVRP